MSNPCNCYYGEDCTKTTVCAINAALEDQAEALESALAENSRLSAELRQVKEELQHEMAARTRESAECSKASARERPAFMAGFKAGRDHPDIEQAWQQYRCQDDSDFRASTQRDIGQEVLDSVKEMKAVRFEAERGEIVNPTVHEYAPEPKPDFDKMNRAVQSGQKKCIHYTVRRKGQAEAKCRKCGEIVQSGRSKRKYLTASETCGRAVFNSGVGMQPSGCVGFLVLW